MRALPPSRQVKSPPIKVRGSAAWHKRRRRQQLPHPALTRSRTRLCPIRSSVRIQAEFAKLPPVIHVAVFRNYIRRRIQRIFSFIYIYIRFPIFISSFTNYFLVLYLGFFSFIIYFAILLDFGCRGDVARLVWFLESARVCTLSLFIK